MENKKIEDGAPTQTAPKMRQIIIETDGTSVILKKAEVSGLIELNSVLSMMYNFLNQPAKAPEKSNATPSSVVPEGTASVMDELPVAETTAETTA